MKNEAFQILIDAQIITEKELFSALWEDSELTLNGPWEGSDYSGCDYTESNQRSLLRDYPELLGHVRYWYCGYGLSINPREFGKAAVRDEAKDLAEILAGLKQDYPVYDEQDNSELIDERAKEAWGSYLRMDLQRELYQLTGADICLDDMEDTFWELLSDHEIWPEAEGHRDVTFPGIGDEPFKLDLAKAALRDGGLDAWTVEDLTDTGYLLVGTWMAEDYPYIHPDQLTLDFPELVATAA
ncbi:hypothetical protein [Nonomuraea jabiensis]|uniref:hypothetical protein n=1 Tax=Nonomuraea jabiensis TaxID=882448 RepID=UPI003D744C7C